MPAEVVATGYPSLDYVAWVSPDSPATGTRLLSRSSRRPQFGGCAANVGVALQRLGVAVALAFALGDDEEGTAYREALAQAGVDVAGVQVLPGHTARSYFFLRPDGEADLYFDPGVSRHWVPARWALEGARWALLTVAPRPSVDSFAAAAGACGARLVWQLKRDEDAFPPESLRALLAQSRVVVMNEGEAAYLLHSTGIAHEDALLRQGPELVAITRGAAGCRVVTHPASYDVPAVPARVVDPIGAGDAFTAGLLFGLERGAHPLVGARIGAVLASFVLEAPGAQTGLPGLERLAARYEQAWGEPFPL